MGKKLELYKLNEFKYYRIKPKLDYGFWEIFVDGK
jgi:hypothetical protein